MTETKKEGVIRTKLFSSGWLDLMIVSVPGRGIAWEYVHQRKAINGEGVAVMPWREGGWRSGVRQIQYLQRIETIPPWSLEPVSCAITGMRDKKGEEPLETAARELGEESGYWADPVLLRSIGTSRVSKASDTLIHMFTVNLTGVERGEQVQPEGEAELGDARWVSYESVIGCDDPIAVTMAARIEKDLRG